MVSSDLSRVDYVERCLHRVRHPRLLKMSIIIMIPLLANNRVSRRHLSHHSAEGHGYNVATLTGAGHILPSPSAADHVRHGMGSSRPNMTSAIPTSHLWGSDWPPYSNYMGEILQAWRGMLEQRPELDRRCCKCWDGRGEANVYYR